MNVRDELADAIAATLHEDVLVCSRVWEAWSYGTMTADDFTPAAEDPDLLGDVADGLLADGYRKPRRVTTEEGLAALPFGSAVLDNVGDIYRSGISNGQTAWWQAGPQGLFRTVALPATVLHDPEATA